MMPSLLKQVIILLLVVLSIDRSIGQIQESDSGSKNKADSELISYEFTGYDGFLCYIDCQSVKKKQAVKFISKLASDDLTELIVHKLYDDHYPIVKQVVGNGKGLIVCVNTAVAEYERKEVGPLNVDPMAEKVLE